VKVILKLELKQNELPLDYRRAFVSFIKSSLCDNLPELFDELYKKNITKQKNFTFDVKLNNPKFEANKVVLDNNEVLFTISTNDFGLGIDFYNSFIKRKAKEHPLANDNYMKIAHVEIENHREIKTNEVIVKFYSPIVVRRHNRGEKDEYFLFNDEEFNEALNCCIENQLKNCGLNDIAGNKIELKPINAKKVVVKAFGINIPGSIGIFYLKGDLETLNAIYQIGAGSRRSEGFGVFEIIK